MGKYVGVMARAVPEPIRSVDGKLIISVVLQPDDSEEGLAGDQIDLDAWPGEIFRRLQNPDITIATNSLPEPLTGKLLSWIPRPANPSVRDALWVKAIGADVLAAAAKSRSGTFVPSMNAAIDAKTDASHRRKIFHSPILNLATSSSALSAVSILRQLGAQATNDDALLRGEANPLSPSTQQSLSVFNVFRGTRPEPLPTEDADRVDDDRLDAQTTWDIIRRLETNGRIVPDAPNRIDPLFGDESRQQTGRSRIEERTAQERATIEMPFSRIPPKLQQVLQRKVEAATPTVESNGRLNFETEYEEAFPEEDYFQMVARGFLGLKPPATATPLERVQDALLEDYADYLLAMQPDEPELAQRKIEKSEKLAADPLTALRVITGIYSYPQLAAFFGLLVDVEIDADALPKQTSLIAVEIRHEGKVVNAPVWTAVSIVEDNSGAKRIDIRPRHPGGPVAQCSQGLLEMGDAMVGNNRRFEIISLNVNAAIDGTFTAARNDYQALLDGATRRDLSSALPSQKGAGLVIADRAKMIEAGHEETDSVGHAEGPPLPTDTRVLYLEDLSVGYRIDVATSNNEPKFSWLSLMDREVHFTSIEAALALEGFDPALLSQQPDWGVDRLAGSIRSVYREVQSENGQPMAVVYDTLASWSGWSLAVPMMRDKVKIEPGEIMLPRRMAPKARSLPSLRYGSAVRFGSRCTLANGSSVTIEAARALYDDKRGRDKYVLRHGPSLPECATDDGYPVLRHEPLATPRVHYHSADFRGEKPDEPNREIAVSLDGHGSEKSARRVVLPGVATFDEAELHGALDRFTALPPAPYGDLPIFPEPGAAIKDPQAYKDDQAPRARSYPDPGIRFLSLAFTEDGVPAEKFGFAPPVAIDLYAGGRKWPNAAALKIEVLAVPDGTLPLHGRIAGDFDLDDAAPDKSGIARARINLAPAEEIDLTIWSLPELLSDYTDHAPFAVSARLAQSSWVSSIGLIPDGATGLQAAMGEFATLKKSGRRAMGSSAVGGHAFDVLQRSLRKLPIPALSSYETIRLVHAVRRPLKAPVLNHLFVMHNAPIDAAAAGNKDNEEMIREAWEAALNEWALDELERPVGEAALDRFEKAKAGFSQGSNRIFIGGSIGFNRKSTGRIDLVGAWLDYSDEIAPRFDRESRTYTFAPLGRNEILATRDGIRYRTTAAVADRIGIARDEESKPTFAGYTFGDTRARKIRIAVRAVTRFKSHFVAAPDDDIQFVQDSEWIDDIVLSTERPKPLPAPFCEPSLHYSLEAYSPIPDSDTQQAPGRRHTRTVRLRFDLGERFYATGVDERVGVVCWPPNLFDLPEIPDIYSKTVGQVDKDILDSIVTDDGEELPKGAADYITRWGRDPISDSGALPALIPASAFRNAVKYDKTRMPLPAAKKPGEAVIGLETSKLSNATIDVSLALYAPILDPDSGRFYVDIEIDQTVTYEPWVRLGLVRYQEHSINGLQCSLPVKSMVRIPADRQLEVEINEARRVSLRYSGLGHGAKRKPSGIGDKPEAALLARPTLDVTVMHTPSPSFSGAPAVIEADAMTGLAHVSGLLPRVDDGQLEWVLGRFVEGAPASNPAQREIVLPTNIVLDDISILITEREHFAADDYRKNFASSRSPGSEFEEPLAWNDTVEVKDVPGTVLTSRIVSAVHLRLMEIESDEQGK